MSAWTEAIRAISDTMARVGPHLDRLIETATAGGPALAPLRPVAADLKAEEIRWRDQILPMAGQGLNTRVLALTAAFGETTESQGNFTRLRQGLALCRADAEDAGRRIADFATQLHALRHRLEAASQTARQHYETDATRLADLDEHARRVMEEAINHVRAVKERQNKWYSGIINSARVVFNISGLVTGFITPDRLSDLGSSVNDLFGTTGITDGIPDHLKQQIERIDRDRRDIARHVHHLAEFGAGLDALGRLEADLGRSLRALGTVAAAWSVIESKIAAVAEAQARIDGPTRFLYVKTTAQALRQLADYTRRLQSTGL